MKNLDRFDLSILRIVQRNGRISNSDLADKVGLSTSACHRRLQRLFEESIISRTVALVDERVVKLNMTVFVDNMAYAKTEEKLEGNDPGAPKNPKIAKKFLITTIITSILFIVIYYLVNNGFLNLRNFLQ